MSWISKITGVFRRGHPDVYEALKDYAEKHGVTIGDVIASATAAYLQTDVEGKEELEKKMAERRMGTPKGGTDIKESIQMLTEALNSMSTVFTALNNVRSSVSIQSIVADYNTLKGAIEGVSKEGVASGAGTIGDKLAERFIDGIVDKALSGGGLPGKKLKKTGKGAGKEEELEEQP